MKRDMELVRDILTMIAEHESKNYTEPIVIKGVPKEKIDYHIEIMVDANILKGNLSYGDNGLNFVSLSLSWYGNDFYDTFQNDNIWKQTKEVVKEKGFELAGIPFDVLIELGKEIIKNMLI